MRDVRAEVSWPARCEVLFLGVPSAGVEAAVKTKEILWPGYSFVFSRSFEGFVTNHKIEAWNRDGGYEILVDNKVVHSLPESELLKFHAADRFDAILMDAVVGALEAIKFCVSSSEEGEGRRGKQTRFRARDACCRGG